MCLKKRRVQIIGHILRYYGLLKMATERTMQGENYRGRPRLECMTLKTKRESSEAGRAAVNQPAAYQPKIENPHSIAFYIFIFYFHSFLDLSMYRLPFDIYYITYLTILWLPITSICCYISLFYFVTDRILAQICIFSFFNGCLRAYPALIRLFQD